MKNPRLDPCQQVIKEYEEAFSAYMALLPSVHPTARGACLSFKVLNFDALQKAQDRLAKAERELLELDAA